MPPVPPTHRSADATDDEDLLVALLSRRSVMCPHCRYNIHRVSAAVCPECGGRLQLTVERAEQSQAMWLLATIAMCIGSAEGVYNLAMIAIDAFQDALDYWLEPIPLLATVYCVLCMPAALALLLTRRAFLRLPMGIQVMLGVLSGGMTVLLFLAWTMSYAADL